MNGLDFHNYNEVEKIIPSLHSSYQVAAIEKASQGHNSKKHVGSLELEMCSKGRIVSGLALQQLIISDLLQIPFDIFEYSMVHATSLLDSGSTDPTICSMYLQILAIDPRRENPMKRLRKYEIADGGKVTDEIYELDVSAKWSDETAFDCQKVEVAMPHLLGDKTLD
jgi:hypothetical protein